MKRFNLVAIMLMVSVISVSFIGCGKKKTEQPVVKPAETTQAPVQQPTIEDPSGPIKLTEVFGDKFIDFSTEPTYQLLISCGTFDGYYAWFNRNCSESITEESYGYSYAQPVPEGGSEADVVPAYGRAITLITDKDNTVVQHYPYHPDFQAFKNWYDNKHAGLLDAYDKAMSDETVYDEEGNIVDLGVASSYYNQAAQMESKYDYYLNSKIRKCYGDVYKPEKNILEMFEECYDFSNFNPDGMCMGMLDLEFIDEVYVNVTKYKLESNDGIYTYIVYVDNETKKVIEFDKYLTEIGIDGDMLCQIQIMYDINQEYQPVMPVIDDTSFANLTNIQIDSLLKQVTCQSMPVFDSRYKVEGFNVIGMTSIASMFNNHDSLIAAELLKFGEDDGNFVNFDSVIWSSVDPNKKSVSCRFIYQDNPVSFTLTPTVVSDDNGNKKDDTYEVLIQTTESRNSNTWFDATDVTDEQKQEVYNIAYENLTVLKNYEVIPEGFEFDIDAFVKWYDEKFGEDAKSDMQLLNDNSDSSEIESAADQKEDESNNEESDDEKPEDKKSDDENSEKDESEDK